MPLEKTMLLFIMLILSSCAVHQGDMSIAPPSADCKIVMQAYGGSQTKKILGIGGLSKDALVLEAKRSMYTAYPLEDGQQYAYVTVDFKRSFFPFYATTKVLISADIVACNAADATSEQQNFEPYLKPYPGSQLSIGNIIENNQGEYKLLSLEMEKVRVQDMRKRYCRTQKLSYTTLFGDMEKIGNLRVQGQTYKVVTGDTLTYQFEGKTEKGILTPPGNLYVSPLNGCEKVLTSKIDILLPKQ